MALYTKRMKSEVSMNATSVFVRVSGDIIMHFKFDKWLLCALFFVEGKKKEKRENEQERGVAVKSFKA